jgi:hypothetical protein
MFRLLPHLTPSSLGMSTPERLTPDRLPDPWLVDTESLLSELGRVRTLALQIPPARNDILGPINSAIDALWDLEQRLRLRKSTLTACPRIKSQNSTGPPHREPPLYAAAILHENYTPPQATQFTNYRRSRPLGNHSR